VALLAIVLVINLLLFGATTLYQEPISPSEYIRSAVPIPCHSHNDYWRKVPVFSALHVGCVGIEADVWLTDGDLYVGHNTESLKPNRTFTSLYVQPLLRILEQQNGDITFGSPHGVYDTNPNQTLVLLVDLKTDAQETWPWVMRQLEPLRERGWLSYAENGKTQLRPITVVMTGNARLDLVMSNTTYRDVFFDAPLANLDEATYDATNSYYASVSFKQTIGVVRYGELSSGQVEKIQMQIASAHARGLKVRYWELPAWPISVRNYAWSVLRQEGVDILNVDDLKGAKEFLATAA
jgi:hypothetical protein